MLFACIFVPDFPAAAIVRNEPELRGQAVAVVEGTPPLLNVVSANEAARRTGVEVGMTKLQAEARLAQPHSERRSAPSLQRAAKDPEQSPIPRTLGTIRRRSQAQEAAAHAALGDCARSVSPRVEEPADMLDLVLIDISGLERLFGTPRMIALELARRAADVALEVNVAVCTNLDAAICAARGFSGVSVIDEEKVRERLAPFPLDVLMQSASVAHDAAQDFLETFDRWGIRTCRAFAALPEVAVSERLGAEGVRLQKLARGEGSRTLAPTSRPAEFEEAIELEYPIEDLESLAFVLNRLIEQVCARLSARALSTNQLQLRMKLEAANHGSTRTDTHHNGKNNVASQPDPSEAQTLRSPDQYERTIRLPVPMLDAKTFLRLWQLEIRGHPPGAPVEKMWLLAEAIPPRFTQGGLFLPATPEAERLEVTLARIAGVVRGNGRDGELRVGSAEVLDTHVPDAFRMKRFVVKASDGQKEIYPPASQTRSVEQEPRASTALRRIRPPMRVSVQVANGRPVRVWGITSDGNVHWCAGPWRISGEWWKDAWAREEWDVALEAESGRVFWRLYRNASNDWFAEGTYD